MWMRFFEGIGKICYDAADSIIALYEGNRLRQIEDGADPARTSNIPNGIDVSRYAPLRAKRTAETPQVLALIGRVVPIKDIMTFVRAMRTVVNQLPNAEAWIIGPEDEDPEYAQECRNLAVGLGIEEKVKFLGFQNLTEVLPQVGVVALPSPSWAPPAPSSASPIRDRWRLPQSSSSAIARNGRRRASRGSGASRPTTTRNRCSRAIARSTRLTHGRHRVRVPQAPPERHVLGDI